MSKRKKRQNPWIEKYRPKKLDDVVHQTEVTNMLKKTLETGNLPHTLFYGPAGTGKTSTILALARELFGPEKYSERVEELNASDERGINIVRKKIVNLSKQAVSNPRPGYKYKCPQYKLIILDEADAMTKEAQSALRKVMESYSGVTRFCFICNYLSKIIDPIKSRCVKFRFKPLNLKSMLNKLKFIAEKENIDITDKLIKKIIVISGGDMRRAIMLLQKSKYRCDYKGKLTDNDIVSIANLVPQSVLDNIEKKCITDKKINIKGLSKMTREIQYNGYPIHNIIKQLNNTIIKNKKLTDVMKSKIFLHSSRTERRLLDGGDEYLELLSLLVCIKSVSLDIKTIHYE